jgi:periplasmic protein TonB
MPLNVRRIGVVVFLVLVSVFGVLAQSPTSADVMRERVTKAKAYIAVKNFNAAIYELEGIRRETSDATVHGVVNVILMSCYLEQGDYKRAQSFLNELFNQQKANKPNAAQNYFAVAAQVVKGARNQFERYKSLGLTVNDRNLPPDAVADIEKMRETVETVITQSKTMSADKAKSSQAFALIEESANARIILARDDFDAKRWKESVADAREGLMSSRTTVLNAVDDGADNTVASVAPAYTNTTPNAPTKTETSPNIVPTAQTVAKNEPQTTEQLKTEAPKTETAKLETPKTSEPVKEAPKQLTPNVAKEQPKTDAAEEKTSAPKTPVRERRVNGETPATVAENKPETDAKTDNSPLKVGSLVEFATQRVNPVYPPQAKVLRMTGVVKVEVTVDEEGKVTEVQNTSGPSMLQRSAVEALKKWKFKPFTRDGQPVKATGFVNFNFNL